MSEPKKDMSGTCGQHYDKYWDDTNIHHTMTPEAFEAWLRENCYKCRWMSDICMFGES